MDHLDRQSSTYKSGLGFSVSPLGAKLAFCIISRNLSKPKSPNPLRGPEVKVLG